MVSSGSQKGAHCLTKPHAGHKPHFLLEDGALLIIECLIIPTLRVQVPNNHILTQNLYYNYYYPKPKYLIIGYMDPLGTLIPSPPEFKDLIRTIE